MPSVKTFWGFWCDKMCTHYPLPSTHPPLYYTYFITPSKTPIWPILILSQGFLVQKSLDLCVVPLLTHTTLFLLFDRKIYIFFLQNIQIAFQDTCFSHDTPPWLTWYSTQEVVRERVTTTVQKNLYNDFFRGFHFTRCCWCNVSANVRQSFLRLGSMGMLPTSHQRGSCMKGHKLRKLCKTIWKVSTRLKLRMNWDQGWESRSSRISNLQYQVSTLFF